MPGRRDRCWDNSATARHCTKWTLATDYGRLLPKICRYAETCRDTRLDAGTLCLQMPGQVSRDSRGSHMSRRRNNVFLPILTRCRSAIPRGRHSDEPPFSAISSSDNLWLGLGSVVWLWQYRELFPATTMLFHSVLQSI